MSVTLNSIAEQIGRSITDFINANSTTLLTILVLILTSSVIIIAFILLFGRRENKRSLYAAFILIILASALATFAPLKEWNALVVGALLTPIFAYFINLLKDKQKLSSEKDRLVWEYKCQQLQKESDVISELLGELSIHAAAFKSPIPLTIETKRWEKSFKASVISELHTLSIASYYNYVIMYNQFVQKYVAFVEGKEPKEFKEIYDDFQVLKKTFFDAEVLVYFTLTYDLGYLQQNYLVRPDDEFPLHLNLMFRNYLQKIGIIRENHKTLSQDRFSTIKLRIRRCFENWGFSKTSLEIDAKKVFSERSSERFNKKTVMALNVCYHEINYQFKVLNSKIVKKKTI